MIRVVAAPEPADFEARIRQRGLDAISELVGEAPSVRRSGPKRAKIADSRDEIPASRFPPFWRDALPEMLNAYSRLCAYLALYIWPATGSATVDHVIPKSKKWCQVYEWSNYRLACSLMNSRKGSVESVLDPFEIRDDLFGLEFVEFQVVPGPDVSHEEAKCVTETIDLLGLNDEECCKARKEYCDLYLGDENVPLQFIEEHAPLVARELRRQRLLRQGDKQAEMIEPRSRPTRPSPPPDGPLPNTPRTRGHTSAGRSRGRP